MYLIVIEAEAEGNAYHYQPYRLAVSLHEARELMRDYLRREPEVGVLIPLYFAVYKEMDGEFGTPHYFDACTPELNETDAVVWLQITGRC